MRKVGNTVYIESMSDGPCSICGKVDELRPYGPGGAFICFDCGNKDAKSRAIRDAAAGAIFDGPGEKHN